MTANSIYSLLDTVRAYPNKTPEYIDKMLHPIPEAKVVDREQFILAKCKGKHILNLGSASGSLHKMILSVAVSVVGVDKEKGADIVCDLDENPTGLLNGKSFDLVVAGEVIEHLANPGNLLKTLRKLACPVLMTVPNAFSESGFRCVRGGVENVNLDHKFYFSYYTLKTLAEKYHFVCKEFFWYGGNPKLSEGLIMVVI